MPHVRHAPVSPVRAPAVSRIPCRKMSRSRRPPWPRPRRSLIHRRRDNNSSSHSNSNSNSNLPTTRATPSGPVSRKMPLGNHPTLNLNPPHSTLPAKVFPKSRPLTPYSKTPMPTPGLNSRARSGQSLTRRCLLKISELMATWATTCSTQCKHPTSQFPDGSRQMLYRLP